MFWYPSLAPSFCTRQCQVPYFLSSGSTCSDPLLFPSDWDGPGEQEWEMLRCLGSSTIAALCLLSLGNRAQVKCMTLKVRPGATIWARVLSGGSRPRCNLLHPNHHICKTVLQAGPGQDSHPCTSRGRLLHGGHFGQLSRASQAQPVCVRLLLLHLECSESAAIQPTMTLPTGLQIQHPV